MKFALFSKLYQEAKEYEDMDMYIAERGWQEWMDSYPEESIGDMLRVIYALYNNTVKEMRAERDLSRAEFCRRYDKPVRTVEDWDSGKGGVSDGEKMLIAYTFFLEDILDGR